ncbi:MAG: YhjD/YihY/BrkB family envelope integrity protein [Caldilineaceae bacterium]
MPERSIAWGDVWIGALASALLFSIGRYLISLYMGYNTVASTYGAAGSLAVLLVWTYYSAQVFFWVPSLRKSIPAPMAHAG